MSTNRTLLVFGVSWLIITTASASEVPVPGKSQLLHSARVTVGATPWVVQGVMTDLSPEAVWEFYARRLPEAGWRIQPVPWMQGERRPGQSQAPVTRPADLDQETLRKMAEEFQNMQKDQLYAEHLDDRLLLNITASGIGTLFFVNRWKRQDEPAAGEPITSPSVGLSQASPARTAGSPAELTNVCCSGAAVSDLDRSLPAWFPVYPGARRISASSPARGGRGSEAYVSEDEVERVAAYYRQQLTWNGWRPLELPFQVAEASGQRGGVRSVSLAYGGDSGLCVVVAAETAGRSAEHTKKERTSIFVSYVPRSPLGQPGGMAR